MKFGACNAKAELSPPFKGQHNVEILTRLGLDIKTIEDMIDSGIVGDGHIVNQRSSSLVYFGGIEVFS